MKIFMRNKIIIFFVLVIAICFSAVIGSTPQKKIARQLDLGNKYLIDADYDQAIVIFEKIIQIDKKNIEAYVGLIEAYISTNDYEKAKDICVIAYEETSDTVFREKNDEISKYIKDGQIDEQPKQTTVNEEEYYLLKKQASSILLWAQTGGYKVGEFQQDSLIDWLNIVSYVYEDAYENDFLPIKISGTNYAEELDPKGYAFWGQHRYAPATEIDWIANNVFNIDYSMLSNLDLHYETDFIYRMNPNYYYSVDGQGIYKAENCDIISVKMMDEKNYQIEMIIDEWLSDEKYTVKIIAELRNYETKRYWSFNEIIISDNEFNEFQHEVDFTTKLDVLDNGTQEFYEKLASKSIDVVGTIIEKNYSVDENVGGYSRTYYVIEFERDTEIYFEDAEGELYSRIVKNIQIDAEQAKSYIDRKVACRIKGWDSMIGALSQWVVAGAIYEIE